MDPYMNLRLHDDDIEVKFVIDTVVTGITV
jgi:hypothetical protein